MPPPARPSREFHAPPAAGEARAPGAGIPVRRGRRPDRRRPAAVLPQLRVRCPPAPQVRRRQGPRPDGRDPEVARLRSAELQRRKARTRRPRRQPQPPDVRPGHARKNPGRGSHAGRSRPTSSSSCRRTSPATASARRTTKPSTSSAGCSRSTTTCRAYEETPVGTYGNLSRRSSQRLVGLNRFTGEVLWETSARHAFRHNAIAAGNGKVFALDRLEDADARSPASPRPGA